MEKVIKKKRQPRVGEHITSKKIPRIGERVAANKNTQQKKQQSTSVLTANKFDLNLNPNTARQAMIFSEIIGPPVSRRRRQK
jgi:hypothetical protein